MLGDYDNVTGDDGLMPLQMPLQMPLRVPAQAPLQTPPLQAPLQAPLPVGARVVHHRCRLCHRAISSTAATVAGWRGRMF